MPDLAQQIRDRLDTLCQYKAAGPRASAAILAVFDLHVPDWDGRCPVCVYSWGDEETHRFPCPTVRAIATALGIEVPS